MCVCVCVLSLADGGGGVGGLQPPLWVYYITRYTLINHTSMWFNPQKSTTNMAVKRNEIARGCMKIQSLFKGEHSGLPYTKVLDIADYQKPHGWLLWL